MGNIEGLVWHLISKLVFKYATVNLSGTGGDEVFAGYTWQLDLFGKIQEESFDDEYYRFLRDF